MKIATLFKVPIYFHWSALVSFYLITYNVALYFERNGLSNIFAILVGTIIALTMFASITAHEFGHILVARKYAIETKEIQLTFLGGMARMLITSKTFLDRKKSAEFFIAIAGPIISIILFLICALFGRVFGGLTKSVIQVISSFNLIVFIFNLIPAFPLDGSRILRSILRYKFDYLQSTKFVCYAGYAFAAALVFYSVSRHYWTLLIMAGFIALASWSEKRTVENFILTGEEENA